MATAVGYFVSTDGDVPAELGLGRDALTPPLARMALVVTAGHGLYGALAAQVAVEGALLARDLANNPPGHLTSTEYGDFATEQGPSFGLTVETYGLAALIEFGCGGLLGVNAGSYEEPRMIVLRYKPEGIPTAHLALVGKGIMYDSGGIGLKPSDPMHLAMKMDMAGYAAVRTAMTGLRDLGATAEVSAWLMCTDNMPSGTATKLGDALRARKGKTVEVKNTDAGGRLAMKDALGTLVGATIGNNQELVDQVTAVAAATGDSAWQLPLENRYLKQLDSDIADISNMGGPAAGTMKSDTDDSWSPKVPPGTAHACSVT